MTITPLNLSTNPLPQASQTSIPQGRQGRKLQRLGLFVDGANVFNYARQYNLLCRYEPLLDFVWQRGNLLLAHFYSAYDPSRKQEDGFYRRIRLLGFRIVREPIALNMNGELKGLPDIRLAFDLGRFANKVDEVILVSADGDFAPVIRALQHEHKRVTIIGPDGSETNAALVIEADDFIQFSQIPDFLVPKNGEKKEKNKNGEALTTKSTSTSEDPTSSTEKNPPLVTQ